VTARAPGRPRALRVAGSAVVSGFFFLEGACASGQAPGASSNPEPRAGAATSPASPFKEIPSSVLAAYDAGRSRAWDPARRFKALFRAEASPKVGAIGRGWLSVWWDGASGTLEWRASAPIAGAGNGGVLRMKQRGDAAAGDKTPLLSARLSAPDLIACILGTPDAAPSPSTALDDQGRVVEMRFPNGEVVKFQPGEGVPRRIEANGPDGRAVLRLETFGEWPAGEEVPSP